MLFVAIAVHPGRADAILCTSDRTPAATLLIPHFEVDVGACGAADGLKTGFILINTGAAPVIVNVTLWTDQSVPGHQFTMYLTGYDVAGADLRPLFCDGIEPGAAQQPGGGGPGDGTTIDERLRAQFTGQPDPANSLCYGKDHGDTIARGYITIDNVLTTTNLTPAQGAYYQPGVLAYDNVLTGSYTISDGSTMFAVYPAVHIEADPSGTVFAPGDLTFYGRFTANPVTEGIPSPTAADRREPLPTAFAVPYRDGVRLQVWREGGASAEPFTCGDDPFWYPLPSNDPEGGEPLVIFNDQEFAIVFDGTELPLESQRVRVAAAGPIPAIGPEGWIYLNLQHKNTSYYSPHGRQGQGWVVVEPSATNGLVPGVGAFPLDSACDGQPFEHLNVGPAGMQPVFPIFVDGFESGDSSEWTGTVP